MSAYDRKCSTRFKIITTQSLYSKRREHSLPNEVYNVFCSVHSNKTLLYSFLHLIFSLIERCAYIHTYIAMYTFYKDMMVKTSPLVHNYIMNKCMILTTRPVSTLLYTYCEEKALICDNQIDWSSTKTPQ